MPTILPLDSAGLDEAARLIRAGGLVAFPTETVYGLGADATNDTAVARIFEAKQRPNFNPLIVHTASTSEVWKYAADSRRAHALADAFWPGALTMVLPRRSNTKLSLLVSAGLPSVAIRVPAHGGARDLLRLSGRPIAAPSANRSGRISPTTAEHVAESLGDAVDLILDGGPCRIGVESTIIDVTGEHVVQLRPGGVPLEALEEAVGQSIEAADHAFSEEPGGDTPAPISPGLLSSHYAPRASVRLNAEKAQAGEVYLGFGPEEAGGDVNLSPTGDLREAAANLFAMLHRLDATGADAIAVAPIPETGLGRAINDRLRRAAAPRD
ncbi:threonylcarbamoyl-AMP synthase [Hwanghaeella grinnelliae]|uniref:Threonylcarbamoyl-AMP synthase n=1 Tax=Hwanghaeella grinnelliae TaxID=2500179 RepID=A0A437QIB1_9PROT|nr:L-threonylcarbamoyladenylate synthase [Hwanghaeella grinnelliae]RVU34293.1 threonylcarbamoyl-AMP synthase [Hwanghaeella grinnelliae]